MDAHSLQLTTGIVVPGNIVPDPLTLLERDRELSRQENRLSLLPYSKESFG